MIKPIQYISLKKFAIHSLIDFVDFVNMKSLGMYKINIIDFNDPIFWRSVDGLGTDIEKSKDLLHLRKAIVKNPLTKIIILYPKNLEYEYNRLYGTNSKKTHLKNNLSVIDNILKKFVITPEASLNFELNETILNKKDFKADFYFDRSANYEVIKTSNLSDKPLAIKRNNRIYTTINFENDLDSILYFLEELELLVVKEKFPEWFLDFKSLNDEKILLEKKNLDYEEEILDKSIEENRQLISNNQYYKSIVYTNGKELVEVVFDILQELLDIDLKDFKDEYNEDFSFVIDDVHYIGEIKGISKNVTNSTLSQLDVHCSRYLDKQEDKKIKIKGLLIINTFRNKPPEEREEIKQDQINDAIDKYNFLIIETTRLLEILTDFRENEITREDFLRLIETKNGLI